MSATSLSLECVERCLYLGGEEVEIGVGRVVGMEVGGRRLLRRHRPRQLGRRAPRDRPGPPGLQARLGPAAPLLAVCENRRIGGGRTPRALRGSKWSLCDQKGTTEAVGPLRIRLRACRGRGRVRRFRPRPGQAVAVAETAGGAGRSAGNSTVPGVFLLTPHYSASCCGAKLALCASKAPRAPVRGGRARQKGHGSPTSCRPCVFFPTDPPDATRTAARAVDQHLGRRPISAFIGRRSLRGFRRRRRGFRS
jgi:hypothetical protein